MTVALPHRINLQVTYPQAGRVPTDSRNTDHTARGNSGALLGASVPPRIETPDTLNV